MQGAIQEVSWTGENTRRMGKNGIRAVVHTMVVKHSSAGTEQKVGHPLQSLVARERVRILLGRVENQEYSESGGSMRLEMAGVGEQDTDRELLE